MFGFVQLEIRVVDSECDLVNVDIDTIRPSSDWLTCKFANKEQFNISLDITAVKRVKTGC